MIRAKVPLRRNAPELVCRALLDTGGQLRSVLRAGAADSHKSRQVVEGCSPAALADA